MTDDTPLRSFRMANAFLHIPDILTRRIQKKYPSQEALKSQPDLIFFITGNPGLIAYYHDFLDLLSRPTDPRPGAEKAPSSTEQKPSSEDCVIAGFSLGGFELDDDADSVRCTGDRVEETIQLARRLCHPPTSATAENTSPVPKTLYTLREQIQLCHDRLHYLVSQLYAAQPEHFPTPIRVTFIGHSVGTYIALELVRKHHEERHASHPERIRMQDTCPGFTIGLCILLTPTVVDLAKSSSGRIATPLLSYIPALPTLVQMGASGLSTVMPRSWLAALVGRVTGMTGRNLQTTVAFLGREGCVKQALAMARDELLEIKEDRWGDEVWGLVEDRILSQREVGMSPKLFFWFARQDHWVADETREEIIKMRGNASEETKSSILVDESEGLVHAWCLEQSVMVATRVKRWIEQI